MVKRGRYSGYIYRDREFGVNGNADIGIGKGLSSEGEFPKRQELGSVMDGGESESQMTRQAKSKWVQLKKR